MANENLLIERLPPAVVERLRARLDLVQLCAGQSLVDAGEPARHAYFPAGGLISLEVTGIDGQVLELAAIGREGMIGVPIILRDEAPTYRVVVQVTAPAYRVRAVALDAELRQSAALQDVLLHYSARVFREITQAVLCHHAHSVLERVCRWLLTAADRLSVETIAVTQERIAQALGADRSAVTHSVGELLEADALRVRRGRVTIRKRPMLEATACECYQLLRGAAEFIPLAAPPRDRCRPPAPPGPSTRPLPPQTVRRPRL